MRQGKVTACLVSALFLCAAAAAGQAHEKRMAYGVERAGQLEAIVRTIAPGSSVSWDPHLTLRTAAGATTPLDVVSFLTSRQEDGSLVGVLAYELGTEKEEVLEKIQSFQPAAAKAAATSLALARVDAAGKVVSSKRIAVDPGDPLTKVESLDVLQWRPGGWPLLRLQYRSYAVGAGSLTTVEWDALFDTQAGSFLARLPAAIVVAKKSGEKTGDFFTVHRSGANEIEIVGAATRKIVRYTCADPCVVDGPTFLERWSE